MKRSKNAIHTSGRSSWLFRGYLTQPLWLLVYSHYHSIHKTISLFKLYYFTQITHLNVWFSQLLGKSHLQTVVVL